MRRPLPHFFQTLKHHGVRSLMECTPQYIGRNVALLRRLWEASWVRIITNTGWYAAVNSEFLPPEAEKRLWSRSPTAGWQNGGKALRRRGNGLRLRFIPDFSN
ncbi:MAG: hypothetical protein EOP86_26010 [Verrucomicrobiaceae bacterium]|nr:MAG: hypothetical protein EOP86_26010 [Verrucomicrobiaceae bacterium]